MNTKQLIKELKKENLPMVKATYINHVPFLERPVIKSSYTAAEWLKLCYDAETIEHVESFYVMYLNRGNRLVACRELSIGGVAETTVCQQSILQTALLLNATGIILSHNLPSGNTQPSESDIKMTRKLSEACKLLRILVQDHIIITPQGDYYSMADNALIF